MHSIQYAKEHSDSQERERKSGFLLLVGPTPQIFEVGEDREAALERAVSILEKQDTVVFLSKEYCKIGDCLVTKDQLMLTRKSN